jgi:hypothetical protein
MGASGVSQRGRKVGVGKKAGVGVGVGENSEVVGIGVGDNAGVGVTLETAIGVDMRSVDMEVSKELKTADMELIARDGVGVDVTREGIILELEGEANVVGCGVGVTVGVLVMAGIWLVSVKGSNPEPPEPNSGNIIVVETIGVLLLLIALEDTTVEIIGTLLLTILLVVLGDITIVEIAGVLLLSVLLVTLDKDTIVMEVLVTAPGPVAAIIVMEVCVVSIRLMSIPEEVKGCDVN